MKILNTLACTELIDTFIRTINIPSYVTHYSILTNIFMNDINYPLPDH